MSSVELLDRTRKIGTLLHSSQSTKVVFNDIGDVLAKTLESNVLVISQKGKVLGIGVCPDVSPLTEFIDAQVGEIIDPVLDERFLGVLSTKENVNLNMLGFTEEGSKDYFGMINPIEIAGDRLGTVFIYRDSSEYTIDDIIVSEYGTTVVALAMVKAMDEELAEEKRQMDVVKSALSTLSYSETEAMISIFDELGEKEGILVASKVADRIGITRSVIVNALRKFESAGVIESRSSGMKGTYIKVKNPFVYEELEEIKKRRTGK